MVFAGSIAPKTPVLKPKCLFACKPPAAIASELARVACARSQNRRLQVFIASRRNE